VGNRRTLIAAAAIVLAVAAGGGVYLYLSGADQRAEARVQLVDAFVAAQDIPKGTTGDTALSQGWITPAKVLRGSVPPAAVTDSGSLKGKVAAATIQSHQYITSASFVAPGEGGGGSLAATISSKDMVAVTVSVDAERGVAGQIAPGDRVNIAVVQNGTSNYLLQAVKVLAVGTQTAANTNSGQAAAPAANSGLITFELSPDDALRVVNANKSGTLYLTLRPLAGGGGNPTPVPASGG
jgi:pilus assembly protein CpaB